MHQATQGIQALPRENPEYEYITTTLYDLIEAINEELQPGKEELLGRIVSHLAEDQRMVPFREPLNQTRKSHHNVQDIIEGFRVQFSGKIPFITPAPLIRQGVS